ncbi:MAG TPA: TRAP transporter large permease subunit [Burkholderiaceae bacterium]|nr:TRAP transporter large permease subunit [Burkholderiaceae bacterium]
MAAATDEFPTTAPAVHSTGGRALRAVDTGLARMLEVLAASLVLVELVLLLVTVFARYVMNSPLTWSDELASMLFLWLATFGAVIALQKGEHLRLTFLVARLPLPLRARLEAFTLTLTTIFAVWIFFPALQYAQDEMIVTMPGLGISAIWRNAAVVAGTAMLAFAALVALLRQGGGREIVQGCLAALLLAGLVWLAHPLLPPLGNLNLVVFFVIGVGLGIAAGLPIAFSFGLATLAYLAGTTHVPLTVVVSRMEDGMSSLILLSVPIFVLLGCVLDSTGMGKAIVDFLGSLLGHVKAGMSYVLLGSLFVVSGISGSKVSDMATVAPALFPEMRKRGHKPAEMVALLATGAAMADTVPPSIVLIVMGAVAGVSIAGLFQAGFVIAAVLLAALLVLARWKARREDMRDARRAPWRTVGKLLLVAGPALVLPFVIRSAVGGGVATATEVSAIAVLYALITGQVLYGGIGLKRFYGMLVETAALSGAILLILGTAAAMAWAITQSGVVNHLAQWLTSLPGGWIGYMVATVVVFVILGCILEGLPAVVLLVPIMFPIARKLGIHDIHYAMVIVCAMNVGLMMPPIGVGFYLACRIGGASPDDVMRAIWPYLAALLAGVAVIAGVPWLSTVAL